ncbi:MAG: CDP-alcohol phosphatidyltransferase family protein [Clostridia bacterium]|nr:CDP-alcohol phosphatidyltransferase family protein [Clostridia bacterium]
MERERVVNIPNAITVIRICLAGAFTAVHFMCPDSRVFSLMCFAAAGFTDFLDGLAARRLNQVTQLGKLLDPLADKIMVLSALVCLNASGVIRPWVTVFVLCKEVCMLAGACMLLGKGIVIQSDFSGKAATFLFVPAVLLVYPWHSVRTVHSIGISMLYASLAIALSAAIHYTMMAARKMRGCRKLQSAEFNGKST